jgi:UDP-N-acetylmuramoyl-tripeptide--D-alanyl-D-alanine ligase
MKRKNFFYDLNESASILIIGKAGKTICKAVLASIFGKNILSTEANERMEPEKIIQLFHRSQAEKKPAIYDIHIERTELFETFKQYIVPDIVIVTNIGEGHLVYQNNKISYYSLIETYIESLKEKSVVVLNKDDDLVSQLEAIIPANSVIKYGLNQQADFFATNIEQNGPYGTKFRLNGVHSIQANIFQFLQIYNFLSAIIVARLFNYSIPEIVNKLEKNFHVPNGKGNLVRMKDIWVINDTYKNTKENVTTAAQTLVNFRTYAKRMIMVIGGMDIRHGDCEQIHRHMGHFINPLPIDIIITVGDKAKPIYEVLESSDSMFPGRSSIHADMVNEAVMNLTLTLEPGDCILLKSNSESNLTKFIDILKTLYI